MIRKASIFLAGAMCGASLYALVAMTTIIQNTPQRSLEDSVAYDACLAAGRTKQRCDATVRLRQRVRAGEIDANFQIIRDDWQPVGKREASECAKLYRDARAAGFTAEELYNDKTAGCEWGPWNDYAPQH